VNKKVHSASVGQARALSGMNELITRIVYVGPPQAEEFKYRKSFYLSNCEG